MKPEDWTRLEQLVEDKVKVALIEIEKRETPVDRQAGDALWSVIRDGVRPLVDPQAFAAAMAEKFPGGLGELSRDDIAAAVREVFADAGEAGS